MILRPIKPFYILLLTVLLLSVMPLTACTAETQTPDEYKNAIVTARMEVWQDINSGRAGSATVAILDKGKIVYAEGFGMADREQSIPVDLATRFNIGSISKVFCASAIMLLVDDGRIKLDEYVTEYLPDFKMADPRYKDITIRMLLNHTSGLPGTTSNNDFGFEYYPEVFTDVLENLSRSHLKYDPGELAVYCNDGFTLAEIIVERVSGQKYIDFLSQRIFQPLALTSTGLSVGEEPDKISAAYYQPDTGKREPLQAVSLLGAGGLGSTSEDLCLFAYTFSGKGKQIFTAESLAEMKKAQPSLSDNKMKGIAVTFGLGWDVTDIPAYQVQGIKVIGKSGGTPNYTSWVLTAPEQEIAVAVSESGAHSKAAKIAIDMLNAVLLQKGLIHDESNTVSAPLQAQVIPEEYKAFYGYYITSGGELINIDQVAETNTIVMKGIAGENETPLMLFIYNNGYFYTDSEQRFYFTGINGRKFLISPLLGMDSIVYQKLEQIKDPKNLKMDISGEIWLIRNAKRFDGVLSSITHLIKSVTYEALPGYVDFMGIKEIESPEFAGMPGVVRDQAELTLFDKEGQTWALASERLYSPSYTAALLENGENAVTIGENGYTEWFSTDRNVIASFEKPEKGRVIVFTDGTPVYDSAVDKGDLYIKKGSFIELAGVAGDEFKVITR